MARGKQRKRFPAIALEGLISVSISLGAITAAYAAGGWTHFIEQQIDPKNPDYHGIGGLLSPSQQKQLLSLDDDASALEDQVSQAIGQGQLSEAQAIDLRAQLGNIGSRQTDILTRGNLCYEDAEGILVDAQRVKATLKAALEGRKKPISTDYYDSKNAFEFRDHLMRKLYFHRSNNTLSANEYDELRSHVEHVGQRLDKEGQSASHDKKLLGRMRQLEADINQTVDGGSGTAVVSTAKHKQKKEKKLQPQPG